MASEKTRKAIRNRGPVRQNNKTSSKTNSEEGFAAFYSAKENLRWWVWKVVFILSLIALVMFISANLREDQRIGKEVQEKSASTNDKLGKKRSHNSKPPFENAKGRDGSNYQKRKPKNDFTATFQKTLNPTSVTYKGREIKFQEIPHQNKESGVRVYIADNFLSEKECDGLTAVHFRHVQETSKQSPIVCFAGVDTMNKHLREAGVKHIGSISDFTIGTTCVNETFSRTLSSKFKYSYSTAFYRGDSKFSQSFEDQVEKTTGLAKMHGGKFQITSYPIGVGYKNHTDCTEDNEIRDRVATVLVYLQDVERGGETKFPKLQISVRPKKGRLLVWNNMRPDGSCDPTSIHNAAKIERGHKVIIQRWYYYKSFFSLGKASPEPELPKRGKFQPRVSCDYYEQGSCRWYDEWGYDHLIEYNMLQYDLS